MKTDFLAWKLSTFGTSKKLKIRGLPGSGGDKRGSNWDPAKAGALPAELCTPYLLVGLKTLRALKIKQRLLAMISSDLTLMLNRSSKRFGLHRKGG